MKPGLRAGWLICAYVLAFFIACLASWIGRTFGNPTIAQAVFHVYYAETAAYNMGEVFIVTFLAEVVAAPLLLGGAVACLHLWAAKRLGGGARRMLRALPTLALAGGMGLLLLQFSVFSYAAAHFGPDRFSVAYRDPGAVALRDGRLRNLVLVYAESLETAYADPNLFGRDLLAPLKEVGGHSFRAYRQAPGTTWTIAAMVATQCGVPLSVYTSEELRGSNRQRTFLPGATCLGDVLQARGYRNVFLGGAPLSFAGKGTFLRDHGYAERYGKEEWVTAGAAGRELGGWGLHDDALLARARDKLTELHAAGQPFNLTVLTLDTHNPAGFMSPSCRHAGATDFPGIVACTSSQLADFVRFARDRGYLDDTVIVIIGDHLAVGNPVQATLQQDPDRKLVNLFVGNGLPAAKRQELLSFDLYPSLLELAGIEVLGGRLGLGVSAWSDLPASEVPQGLETLQLPILSASDTYMRLWRAPPEP